MVLTASIALVSAGAGGWSDADAPLHDFTTGAVIKTGYWNEAGGDDMTRMWAIQFKSPTNTDYLQLEAKDVYLMDAKWKKKYINTFRSQENGTYSNVYSITPSLRVAVQFNEVIFMTDTNCKMYDTLAKQKMCDRKTKTQFNILSARYKSVGVKFADGSTKDMKFKFSHQDTIKEFYEMINGTGN